MKSNNNSKTRIFPKDRKIYVLDTSVLMNSSTAFLQFKEHIVMIPIWVFEELDKHKSGRDMEKRFIAREASRTLDEYTEKGDPTISGIDLPDGGKLFLGCNEPNLKKFSLGPSNDNKIIVFAKSLQVNEKQHDVVVVSDDSNMRNKARNIGLEAESFKYQKVNFNGFSGLNEVVLKEKDFKAIVGEEVIDAEYLGSYFKKEKDLFQNEFYLFTQEGDEKSEIFSMLEMVEGKLVFRVVDLPDNYYGVTPRNTKQGLALVLLREEKIPSIALWGSAGGGKTFLALSWAYRTLKKDKELYDQILIYRSNHPLGKDLGALPGDLDEKFAVWAQPIRDLMEEIVGEEITKRPKRQKGGDDKNLKAKDIVEEMIKEKKIEILPISFIRGRTFSRKIVILDEAQNLDINEMRTFMTRLGENFRLIVTGDITQVDNDYVDEHSNGLTHLIYKARGAKLFAHLKFEKSERSESAEFFANHL